jgi:hypothetical protein
MKNKNPQLMNDSEKYIRQVTNPFFFRLFVLKELPMLFLAGVRVKELSPTHAVTTLKFSYLTKNPFRSIYFGCLGMAAELSSGIIAMMHVRKANPKVSMLVTGMKAEFTKKAVGRISFTCKEGQKIADGIAETQKSGNGVTFDVVAVGTDEAGDTVATFVITWSFKRKG